MSPKTTQFADILKTVKDVPALPEVYHRLMETLNSPMSTAEQVSDVIGTDTGITSKVLKLVNSAFYGFPSQITSITRAVVILGFNEVRNMVIATSVIGSFMNFKDGRREQARELWKHSLGVAIFSRQLGRKVGLSDSEVEDIFVAGLLHDIGKLVHLSALPKEFEIITRRSQEEDLHYTIIEKQQLGSDHTFTARLLLKNWKLPPQLRFIVSRHHQPRVENRLKRSVAVVHIADSLAHYYKFADLGFKRIPRIDKKVFDALRLTTDDIASLEEDTRNQIAEMCKILEIS